MSGVGRRRGMRESLEGQGGAAHTTWAVEPWLLFLYSTSSVLRVVHGVFKEGGVEEERQTDGPICAHPEEETLTGFAIPQRIGHNLETILHYWPLVSELHFGVVLLLYDAE